MRRFFNHISRKIALFTGSPLAFSLAFILILAWTIGGFFVGFNNTLYQLLVNTGTTIITFLMVFLIQNSQNTDTLAIHLKLDELLKSNEKARNELIDIEEREGDSPEEIRKLKEEFKELEKEEIKSEI